ncbi:DEAD/DEAH box helicase family protein [Brevibacillus humidisoli]|uniref:DEAD/DEAH box helicase n=1 Tax=Brevibacillus humidisoli TaxID=2895522 RepID=UPI001E3E5477|nr:helicase-related protein [Brevibacillus humidisoli]UFJ40065.1 DEAD/DEAH box helicase family protein [Brevibacillus humidisoli]
MHEYLLYVKKGSENRCWDAYVTPCFQVDRIYWQERNGGHLQIVGKSRSLALAFALREEIGRMLALGSSSLPIEQIRKRVFAYVRELNQAYRQKAQQQAAKFGDGEFVETDDWSYVPYSFETSLTEEEADSDSTRSQAEKEEVCLPEALSDFKSISAIQMEEWAEQLLLQIGGRALLMEEIKLLLHMSGYAFSVPLMVPIQWLVLQRRAALLAGIRTEWKRSWWRNRLRLICQRCGADETDGSVRITVCHTCRQGCAYCLSCLQMGRSKCCTPYIQAEQVRMMTQLPSVSRLQWSGSYSPLQERAAEQARRFVVGELKRPGDGSSSSCPAFLIWAVCGAGKTELIFPAIDETLQNGGRVLIATPRKDVVLELAPRLRSVFPSVEVAAIYGGSEQKWSDAELTLSTTHQVLRFYQRFELVIVDEVDAFPFHGDPMLHRAVQRAVGSEGKLLYLTATPPQSLRDRLVRFGPPPRSLRERWGHCVRQLTSLWRTRFPLSSATHVMVPLRYHGHPLPVPQNVLISGLSGKLQRGQTIPLLAETIIRSIQEQRQVFVFVPRVAQTARILAYLRRLLPDHAVCMEAVSAADPEREQKVNRFRERSLRLLVTTTILERGVTIPRSDVIVLEADDPVFDEASLVQIAGRVGRSADDPDGTALFLLNRRSSAPYAAVKQIRAMNRLAAEVTRPDVD